MKYVISYQDDNDQYHTMDIFTDDFQQAIFQAGTAYGALFPNRKKPRLRTVVQMGDPVTMYQFTNPQASVAAFNALPLPKL